MAERRMFAKTIIDSDAFLDMPATTQLLYFHLSMRADDDGFVNNPKKIQRMVGCSDDDLKLLMAKQFILTFDSGVIVIKHWKIHNYIQNDRYKPTVYAEEKAMLQTKENKAYTLEISPVYKMDTECIQGVSKMDSQVRLVKDRLVEDSLGKDNNNDADDIDLSTDLPNLSTAQEKIDAIIKEQWKRTAGDGDRMQAVNQLARLNGDYGMLALALEIAGQHGERARNWNYATAIIDSWLKKGYKTEEDVLLNEMNRKGGAR